MDDVKPVAIHTDAHTQHILTGRVGILATMHGKEQVIAPLFEQAFGMQIQVPNELDTDRFGTFTRDVKRTGDQLAAARLKAQAAMEISGCAIGLASEGSFGPHPVFPYLGCNREIVVLIDRQHDLEIVGQAISSQTNYSQQQVSSLEAAFAFAEKAGFPEHGLVVMANLGADATPTSTSFIRKGITTPAELTEAVEQALAQADRVHLETDMRAMHNPSRMQVIAAATQDLIRKLQHPCPHCTLPGFDEIKRIPGLRCSWCGQPTSLTQAIVYGCKHCDFEQEVRFPDGTETAAPTYCSYCNP